MMKRFFAALLLIVLLLSGCAQQKQQAPQKVPEKTSLIPPVQQSQGEGVIEGEIVIGEKVVVLPKDDKVTSSKTDDITIEDKDIIEPEEKQTAENKEMAEKTEEQTVAPQSSSKEFTLEADDYGFYPSDNLVVNKGDKVKITFRVRSENVYYAGLKISGKYFDTGDIAVGGMKTVEFTADASDTITSYWPSSGVRKADVKLVVQ